MAMAISAEMFTEIISSLKSDATVLRGHEKRKEGRVGLRCTVEVIPCTFSAARQKPLGLQMRDLSQSGIGLVSPLMLDENMEFVARFPREGHPMVPVLYRTRHCRRLTNDLFAVGAMLMRVLPDAQGDIVTLNRRIKPAQSKPALEQQLVPAATAD